MSTRERAEGVIRDVLNRPATNEYPSDILDDLSSAGFSVVPTWEWELAATPGHDRGWEIGALTLVADGVVALYRPSARLHPWHCYNTSTGEFIECRTDKQVAGYHRIPGTPRAPGPVAPAEVEDGKRVPLAALAGQLTRLIADDDEITCHHTAEKLRAIRSGIRAHRCGCPWHGAACDGTDHENHDPAMPLGERLAASPPAPEGEVGDVACAKTDDGHLCFATARADLRYLIVEASALNDTATDERLAQLHDVIEHAMVTVRDLAIPRDEEQDEGETEGVSAWLDAQIAEAERVRTAHQGNVHTYDVADQRVQTLSAVRARLAATAPVSAGSPSCDECQNGHCTDPGDSCSRMCCPRCQDDRSRSEAS